MSHLDSWSDLTIAEEKGAWYELGTLKAIGERVSNHGAAPWLIIFFPTGLSSLMSVTWQFYSQCPNGNHICLVLEAMSLCALDVYRALPGPPCLCRCSSKCINKFCVSYSCFWNLKRFFRFQNLHECGIIHIGNTFLHICGVPLPKDLRVLRYQKWQYTHTVAPPAEGQLNIEPNDNYLIQCSSLWNLSSKTLFQRLGSFTPSLDSASVTQLLPEETTRRSYNHWQRRGCRTPQFTLLNRHFKFFILSNICHEVLVEHRILNFGSLGNDKSLIALSGVLVESLIKCWNQPWCRQRVSATPSPRWLNMLGQNIFLVLLTVIQGLSKFTHIHVAAVADAALSIDRVLLSRRRLLRTAVICQ